MNRAPSNNSISRAAKQLNNKIKARRSINTNGNNRQTNVTNSATWGIGANSKMTIMTIIATLLVVIVLVAAGRWLWSYHRDEQSVAVDTFTLLDGANAADNEFTISSNQMPPSTYSNEYALSLWVYVDDYNYRRDQDKFILRRGRIANDGAVNPEITLHPYHNTLEVAIGLQTDKSPTYASQQHHPECAANNNNNAETFIGRPNNVHPIKDLSNNYFSTMDGVQLVPNPDSGKRRGLALARLHQDHSERFQDSADSSAGASVPTEEGDVQNAGNDNGSNATTANEENCECTCGANNSTSNSVPLTREEWLKTAARCMVPDFPLQKWVHVVVSQYNQVLDVFVDGHLASSCPMNGFPAISTDNLVLCPDGGFSGRVARVTYSNTSLSANEVQALYRSGPDSNYKPIRQHVPTWAVVTVVLAILLLVALVIV